MDLLQDFARLNRRNFETPSLIETVASELGVQPDASSRPMLALALVRGGRRPEEVSKKLDWREFENFCSKLLTAYGYSVKENVVLKKPRAQIDLVAMGPRHILSVDCKHWRRDHGPSVLTGFARRQLARSELLRRSLRPSKPIVSIILSFSQAAGTFAEGVAVVPVRTLRDFVSSIDAYTDSMKVA